MKILGIDYGERRIGLALGETKNKIAFPYGVLKNEGFKRLVENLKDIVRKEEIEKIVVGLPLSFDFSETQEAKKIKRWAYSLEKALGLPVEFENEFLTSQEARKRWPQKKLKTGLKDQTASVIILQAYLDRFLS